MGFDEEDPNLYIVSLCMVVLAILLKHENFLSRNAVLSFTVGSLSVKYVIILGHHGCGGVATSMMWLDEQPVLL